MSNTYSILKHLLFFTARRKRECVLVVLEEQSGTKPCPPIVEDDTGTYMRRDRLNLPLPFIRGFNPTLYGHNEQRVSRIIKKSR